MINKTENKELRTLQLYITNIVSYILLVATFYFMYLIAVSRKESEVFDKIILLLQGPIGWMLISIMFFLLFKGAHLLIRLEIAVDKLENKNKGNQL
jgi:hypothetical protein